jgi:HAE1 family hydrophobic/amphiphilic exporter-1
VNIADLSIKRPVFITAIFSMILIVGYICFRMTGIDLFPNVTFPVVVVTTIYPGAGPEEIELQVSKPIEEQITTLSGIKTAQSISREGVSIVVAEFTYETDIKYATQQVRDRISGIRAKLPTDIKDPIIRNVDTADLPVAVIGVAADLTPAEMYDLIDERVKPRFEQVNQVGVVDLYGARKREIQVALDRDALKKYEIPAGIVAQRIAASGKNIPVGKVVGKQETVIRSMAEFSSLKDIENTVVNFIGNDVPVLVRDVAKVYDGLTEETTRGLIDGKPASFLYIYKQSGANTVAVYDAVEATLNKLNKELLDAPGKPRLTVVRNGALPIRMNVDDVKESIIVGIILTILVVYLFLANFRSTLITGVALPNSLIGAFVLIYWAGFTINVTSLLGLSLAVGLLIDDAIVVRENIFRHMEMGKSPEEAASIGTKEVVLAVVATTFCILAVFGPVAFIGGMTGRFMREFGGTVCFAMIISLFDALTMGPMLSAYLGGVGHHRKSSALYRYTIGAVLKSFDHFQEVMAERYEQLLRVAVKWPSTIILASTLIFVGSLLIATKIPVNFSRQGDMGDFVIDFDLPAGTTLDTMQERTLEVENIIRKHKEVSAIVTTIGRASGEANQSNIYVRLVPFKKRKLRTNAFKDMLREELKPYADMHPKFGESMTIGGAQQRAFQLNIVGTDLEVLKTVAGDLMARLKDSPDLKDLDWNWRPGKPELQIQLDSRKADKYGISSASVGGELRTMIEGATPAVFRNSGKEYDIRVRLKEEQRALQDNFSRVYVPNVNMSLVPLADISTPVNSQGPATINRQDRGRYIQVTADIAANGGGLGKVRKDVTKWLSDGTIKVPPGVRTMFVGQSENFAEMMTGIVRAMLLGICFIYIVLASLYESYITPLTIMLVFPLAICGAFIALFVMGMSLDMMALIGCVLLIGLACKNSILLVDYANQLIGEGLTREEAIIRSGRVRLRPILMTSIALIAGMLPVAIGLSEVSSARQPMGVGVIGGVISSTLLTLVVVPAVYSHIDRFRVWSKEIVRKVFAVS